MRSDHPDVSQHVSRQLFSWNEFGVRTVTGYTQCAWIVAYQLTHSKSSGEIVDSTWLRLVCCSEMHNAGLWCMLISLFVKSIREPNRQTTISSISLACIISWDEVFMYFPVMNSVFCYMLWSSSLLCSDFLFCFHTFVLCSVDAFIWSMFTVTLTQHYIDHFCKYRGCLKRELTLTVDFIPRTECAFTTLVGFDISICFR